MAVISHRYGFIFVKTTKTAGTSIEVHLSQACGDEDVFTPIFPNVDGHRPRNWVLPTGEIFYNHISALEIRESIGPKFNDMFRFCFERHPVDKCLSHFAMLSNSPYHTSPFSPASWYEYLDLGNFPIDDGKYLTEDGRLLVDRIYRYERMNESLRDVCAEVNLSCTPLTVHAKSGFRVGIPTFEAVMADKAVKALIFDAFQTTLSFTPY